jgi:hypothetical protein
MVLLLFSALAPAQTTLQVTSPTNASGVPVLKEGQTYTITLSADPSVSSFIVVPQSLLPAAQPTTNPLQFSLTLPTSITPGIYTIGAVGFTSSSDVEAYPVQIDVERSDAPVSIRVMPLLVMLGPPGTAQPVNVQGTFSDGSTLSVSNSSLLTYTSETPSVVTSGPAPIITSVTPTGGTARLISYKRLRLS